MTNPTSNFGWQMPTTTDLVTDLPADFALFGQAVDTSMADLKGGTTGQVLSKASNTDMDFTWVTDAAGDITGVTAGTGISGGGTSGTVTVTNSMATAITTAGDLIKGTGSGTFDRLGIGSSGQILTVSAGAPAWATPAAGGGWTLLTSGSLPTGASTVTLSSISQSYKNLRLLVKKMQNSTDATNFNMRWNGATTNYDWAWDTGVSSMAQTSIRLMSNIDNTVQDGFTVIDIPDYANTTTYKFCIVNGWNTNTLTTSVSRNQYQGGTNSTSAISSITIFGESGTNFDAGTYELYGEN